MEVLRTEDLFGEMIDLISPTDPSKYVGLASEEDGLVRDENQTSLFEEEQDDRGCPAEELFA